MESKMPVLADLQNRLLVNSEKKGNNQFQNYFSRQNQNVRQQTVFLFFFFLKKKKNVYNLLCFNVKFGRQVLISPIPTSLRNPNLINSRDFSISQQHVLPKLESSQNPSFRHLNSRGSFMRSSLPSNPSPSLYLSQGKGSSLEQKPPTTPDKARSSTPENKMRPNSSTKSQKLTSSASKPQSPKNSPQVSQPNSRPQSPKNQAPCSLPPVIQTHDPSPMMGRRAVSPMSRSVVSPIRSTSENPTSSSLVASSSSSPSPPNDSVLSFFERVKNQQSNLEFVYCKIAGGIYEAFNPYNMIIIPYTNVGIAAGNTGVNVSGIGISNQNLHSTKITPLLGKKYITASVKVSRGEEKTKKKNRKRNNIKRERGVSCICFYFMIILFFFLFRALHITGMVQLDLNFFH
jgi:hypothetical protein